VSHPLRPNPAALRSSAFPPRLIRAPLAWRLLGDEPDAPEGESARDRSLALVEAALFLADEPLTARRLAAAAGLADAAEARRLACSLRELYQADGSAFQVEELAGGYQLLTLSAFHPWLVRLRLNAPSTQLSAAAREALTLVAYRQPVTRADVEAIRGVNSKDVLDQLTEKGLIGIAGRDDSLGRPTLYATTKKFLQTFGLKSLRELPPAEGLMPERPPPRQPPAAEETNEEGQGA
jgi:segregation and condensation protein B